MTPQSQLIEHDPENGRYGDCQRTCVAAILDMKAEDVPHFCDGADTGGEWLDKLNAWLDVRGFRYARFGYEGGSCTLDQVLEWTTKCNPGVPMILNGRSALGSNHVVIIQDGAIACDPSGNGIVGPNSDGLYVVEVIAVGSDWGRHRSITAGLGALVGDAIRDLDQLAIRQMHRGSDVTITFDVAGEPFAMTVRHDLEDAGPDDFPTRKHDQHSPEYARCVAIADRIVPAYRAEGSNYSCTGHIAKKWEAAFEGAAAAIGADFVLSSSNSVDQPAEAPPHFDMVTEGDGVRMVALPTWQRNNESTFLRLQLEATNDVTPEQVAGWTDDQCKEADVWACSVHLSASDNDDVIVPPRPTFIGEREGPATFRSDFANWKERLAGDVTEADLSH